MKLPSPRYQALLLGLCVTVRSVFAQTTTTAEPGASPPPDKVVQLNPFEVQADSDHSYGAVNSNSITNFNVELSKLPISANIFDSTFMSDTASTGVEDMIRNYSAGAGFQGSDPGANSYDNQPGDRIGGAYLSLRGLQTPTQVRDGFLPVGSFGNPGSTGVGFTSNFDIERVEIIMGPQAMLYAGGGAGGVINVVSKEARIGQPAFGSAKYQVDQYGNKLSELDYGVGVDNFAARVALISQNVGGRRANIGGPMSGAYVQFAGTVFGTTTVRLTGEQTVFSRMGNSSNTVVAASTSADARNGDYLHYLLATNQINAAANGAPSGMGPIDNGNVNWSNVDSFEGWDQSDNTVDDFETLTVETLWNPHLSTKFSLGYNNYNYDQVTAGFTFNSPTAANNPLGAWAAAQIPSDTEQPARTKTIRYSILATNDFFGGKVHSQSILGIDYVRTDNSSIVYQYFQADSNWNVITTPGVTAANGRTTAPRIYWNINNGPVEYPNFRPASPRVTIAGVNYVRMIENEASPTAVSPSDPLGVTLGGSAYNVGDISNKGIYGVNYSQWMDKKLDTLIGFRLADSYEGTLNAGAAPPTPSLVDKIAQSNTFSFDIGADYSVTDWLHPYFSVSDSYDPPATQTGDPYGAQPPTAHGLGQEVGVKIQNKAGSLSGSLALYHVTSSNEQYEITSSIENDVNPSGLNGRYGTAGNYIPVERESRGLQAIFSANPVQNWRIALTAAVINGKINSSTSYNQLYNDQFNQNSAGDVTYADGSIVYVNPTYNSKQLTVPAGTAGAIPLTITSLSTPSSSYYANPQPVNGQIQATSNGGKVLAVVDPTHGSILTGATGLPISMLQINPGLSGVTIPGNIVTSQAGDYATGYPVLSYHLTSVYTFTSGPIKGLRVGGTASQSWYNRTNYYYSNGIAPGASRILFDLPNEWQFDAIVGYSRKFGRVTWSSQLNVTNIFNHYEIVLLPNGNTGWAPVGTNATFTQQPRNYVASTTLSF